MRIFTASLATETNTFSPIPTDRASFEMAFYAGPGRHPDTPTLCSAPMVVLRRRAKLEGFSLIEGTAAWAEPGGLLQLEAYEDLRDEILDQLRAALPVDGVILGLHGAMVAQGCDDCEGDLLERVRAIVGPKVVVAAELDPHSHLTKKRVANANTLAAPPCSCIARSRSATGPCSRDRGRGSRTRRLEGKPWISESETTNLFRYIRAVC